MKASKYDDLDAGNYITFEDLEAPDRELFQTEFFFEWAYYKWAELTNPESN